MDFRAAANTRERNRKITSMKNRSNILIIVSLIANFAIGQEALDFTITDTKGETWNLFDELAKGKTVVLDFFFVNCTPCQELTPAMAQLYSEYDKDSLLVLGLSDRDINDKVVEFENEFGVNYPSAGIDGGGDTVTDLYRSWFSFVGWPTYAVVCPNREIQWNLQRDTNFIEVRKEIGKCKSTLSTSEVSTEDFQVYPNPIASNNTLVLSIQNNNPVNVRLVSLTGQVVLEEKLSQTRTFKIPPCSNGIYQLEVIQKDLIYQSKIIINNY